MLSYQFRKIGNFEWEVKNGHSGEMNFSTADGGYKIVICKTIIRFINSRVDINRTIKVLMLNIN